jgi:hypothetical protein
MSCFVTGYRIACAVCSQCSDPKHVMMDPKPQRHVLLQVTGLLVLCAVSALFLNM